MLALRLAETPRVHVQGFTRRPATRRNFPADLPRRRIVHPAPDRDQPVDGGDGRRWAICESASLRSFPQGAGHAWSEITPCARFATC
jgi:hypothetical protein